MSKVCGFNILRNDDGTWFLQDTDTFNNWGTLSDVCRTKAAAEDFARECDAFKRGRRMTLRRPGDAS